MLHRNEKFEFESITPTVFLRVCEAVTANFVYNSIVVHRLDVVPQEQSCADRWKRIPHNMGSVISSAENSTYLMQVVSRAGIGNWRA